METDIRWIQRFDNYTKALAKLNEAVALYKQNAEMQKAVLDLVKEGLVQRFEYTQELAWNVMKDYEMYQGETDIYGSRDSIRKALSIGIISDARWMNTIVDRNNTSHIYDEDKVDDVVDNIVDVYSNLFNDFAGKMRLIIDKECTE